MGILSLLRNTFGRSRKGRTAETEGADPTPHHPVSATTPTDDEREHELVSAAFDNITIPKQPPAAEPERVAVAEPEPVVVAEPEPVAVAEPVAERVAEPEPEVAVEPEREPTAVVVPEPEAVAEPEPEAAVEPVAEPERTPEPEATAEPEPTPQPEPTPEPEQAAVAAPEALTEPEQTADRQPEPTLPSTPATEPTVAVAPQAPQAPEGEARAEERTPEPEAATAPRPLAPATPLTTLKNRAPALAPAYKAATATLRKKSLTGTRAKLYLVLDRSASMRPYYKDASTQILADRTLALAAHLDRDPEVHVVFFSTEIDGTTDLTLAKDHGTRITDTHATLGRMGRTSYHTAVEAVLKHYDAEHAPGTRALVVFQTDGAPDAKIPATQALTDAAKTHPDVFFSFVAFGEHDTKAFDYLRRLKAENASFFHAGPAPSELTDTELYAGVLANWRP
ncbi:VWA domain-containing protein [Streptomyces sp. J2-1]|uniref:VWA domain-containing protein n=1 Tax=Streptomyces corallincola TaxID=2851888 RepID=UPI001C3802A4|nr:VWA domain-containing protein [Streptomyces corallincola]MBV2356017.1 VWA domain-containing protein [Streptomyces corallincola]